jgi:hypothetical protein
MPNQNYHGGYPIGSVDYVPKSFKRRGAFIRYISAGSVIWLLKPDIDAHYAHLEARARTTPGWAPGWSSRFALETGLTFDPHLGVSPEVASCGLWLPVARSGRRCRA